MPFLKLYGTLSRFSNKNLSIEAENLKSLIENASKLLGEDFKKSVLDGNSKVKEFVRIYVNNKDIRFLDGLETRLSEEDKVVIMPALAGG